MIGSDESIIELTRLVRRCEDLELMKLTGDPQRESATEEFLQVLERRIRREFIDLGLALILGD